MRVDKDEMVETLALQFIEDHREEWLLVLDRVSIGRQLRRQEYLDEANRIIAPLIEKDGYGINGETEVARELWRLIRAGTEPERKPEDEVIDDLPF